MNAAGIIILGVCVSWLLVGIIVGASLVLADRRVTPSPAPYDEMAEYRARNRGAA